MVQDWFVHGPLLDASVRAAVLGLDAAGEDAVLAGHVLVWPEGAALPVLVPGGDGVDGLLLRGLEAEAAARLTFFLVEARGVEVQVPGGPVSVLCGGFGAGQGPAWDLAAWAALWAPALIATLPDIMALRGSAPAAAVRERLSMMLVRGASRVRAAQPAPATLRGSAQGVEVFARRTPYAHFFAVEEYDLSFRRFDGSMSPIINRAAFISGDAVTVLPYDPVRDRVLLIEQFRAGPFSRGDAQPWQLEAIAGRIDPEETPEAAARREAVEEAGLTLGALLPVAGYYPTPGAKSEFLYSFVAVADLPDDSAGVYGVEGEAEDILGHLISFDALMALVASGEVANAPLILTAFWLQRERAHLRAAAQAGLKATPGLG